MDLRNSFTHSVGSGNLNSHISMSKYTSEHAYAENLMIEWWYLLDICIICVRSYKGQLGIHWSIASVIADLALLDDLTNLLLLKMQSEDTHKRTIYLKKKRTNGVCI